MEKLKRIASGKMSKTVRNIIIFSAVAISCGWFGILIDQQIDQPAEQETLGMGLWLIAPLLTVVVLRSFAGDGWKDVHIRPNFSENLKWHGIAIFAFPLITAITLFLGKIFGWIDFHYFQADIYWTAFLTAFIPNFIKNIFEESVWRGYLTTKLIQLKIKDIWLYLIVGFIWGIWHLPYYLHFLPESDMHQVLPVSQLSFAIIAIFSMICWTVLFVEVFRLTQSIWSVVLLHSIEDSLINHLIIDKHLLILEGKEFLISPIVGIIPLSLFLLLGIFLRRERKRKENRSISLSF